MRKTIAVLIAILLLFALSSYAQVSINEDGSSPNSSAMLDVKSTDKGFLPPRMTEAQMNAISSPVAGLIVYCTDCDPKAIYTNDGSDWLVSPQGSGSNNAGNAGIGNNYGSVVNDVTGMVWLDRNLGATQVATSSTDAAAYGYLFQWGRAAEGHQVRTSATDATLATTWIADEDDNAWDGKFITCSSSPFDWLSTQKDDLWTGTAAENNPCPSGYRIPTNAELNQERLSWASNNAAGAYGSPLKLTLGGVRGYADGVLLGVGTYGAYWSSTVNGTDVRGLAFTNNVAAMGDFGGRGYGISVRCIKD